jgi:hypothetical protein
MFSYIRGRHPSYMIVRQIPSKFPFCFPTAKRQTSKAHLKMFRPPKIKVIGAIILLFGPSNKISL